MTEASVTLARDYRDSQDANSSVDSLTATASRNPNVKALLINAHGKVVLADTSEPVELAPDLFLTVKTTRGNNDEVNFTKLTLKSSQCSASQLLDQVLDIDKRYHIERSNAIGDQLCYFEHKPPKAKDLRPIPGMTEVDKRIAAVSSAAPRLTFGMTQFHSNKQFSNLFGEQIRGIEQRVRFFADNRAWYDQRGIPYQLGMLFSNMSGCGKSSAIRAIANFTKRHIINVNFGRIVTFEQLNNLFFNEVIDVEDSRGDMNTLTIPIDRRLYVIEELDAASSIVYQRGALGTSGLPAVEGELTLADILLVLDGNRESPGRMVIMTANHPELLDQALVRPGRMDLVVSFKSASDALISEMYRAFFDSKPPKNLIKVTNRLTPAEVSQVFFKHVPKPRKSDDVLRDLCARADEKQQAEEASRLALKAHAEAERQRRLEAAQSEAGLTAVSEFMNSSTQQQLPM